MKDYGNDPLHWQTVAEDRSTWRTGLNGGPAIDIDVCRTNQEIERARRHAGNLPA